MNRINTHDVYTAIEQAIKWHGPLQLMALRDRVNERLHIILPVEVIKSHALMLCEHKQLRMRKVGNGYLFSFIK